MTALDDEIPTIGEHRGCPLHDCQDEGRLVTVKSEIDVVMDTLDDVDTLFDWIKDPRNSPESRLLAKSKIEALYDGAAERREVRPEIDMDLIKAWLAGANSQKWRSSKIYGSLFDERHLGPTNLVPDRGVKRTTPLVR